MDIQRLLTGLSLKIIIQLAVVFLAALVLLGLNYDIVYPFYFENQLTHIGIVINGAILALLLVGLGNILYHLLRYRREEAAIVRFVRNTEGLRTDLMEGIAADSIVARRHETMRSIQRASGEINHAALASMLNADEGTRFGLVRFINNILILTGVFGTIVSLSIALIGASDLIDSSDASIGGMGLVIHGMSTALSTTITAIVSYVFFGYFYNRLNDVQTHFLSGVEQLTSVYLLPRFVKTGDEIVLRMGSLVDSVIQASDKLRATQDTYHEAALELRQAIGSNHQVIVDLQLAIGASQQQIETLGTELEGIKQILREGFRLPASRQES